MKKVYSALLLVLIVLSAILFYVNLKTPIKIALIGNFEEERYSFATSSIIAGRIAENDINAAGGIKGRSTELIIRNDDFKSPEETIKFLKENKIEAVITTAPSKDLLNVRPYLEDNKIVCLSVGATSATLSDQKDYIYRILPDDETEIKTFFNHLTKSNIEKDIVLIYDKSNLEYKNSIESTILSLGGKVSFQEGWDGDSISYTPSNIEAIKNKPILIISPPRHTAFILQRLKGYGITSNIFGTSWSGDDYLLSYGGRAVEGFIFTTPVDFTGEDKVSLELSQKLWDYEKKTGIIPDGVYKAYNLIKTAYEDRFEHHVTLKEALDKNSFFDEYGDSAQKELVFKVKNGEYAKLGGSSYED